MTRIVKPIFVFILSCIASLLLLEGYFQITEFQLPYFELSSTVGKKMLPSKRITHFSEGFYLGGTNQYGYLGTGYPIEKTPGKVRVAIIGDSYVEGLHVSDKEHFTRIAETILNKSLTSPKYEVLNFGVGNYNYNDMIISYMNYIRQFKPDIIVFLLEKGDFEFRPNFMPSPSLKLEKDSVVIDYSFTKTPVFKTYQKFAWAFENSALVSAANNAFFHKTF
ncbi:MAG: SGNH/GDSL hydrolase family protein [Chitinophagaceae bacterium]|nr:MAG: SGNH/GDSL hydrolase family protein [Chitinophagaceae bacterium]